MLGIKAHRSFHPFAALSGPDSIAVFKNRPHRASARSTNSPFLVRGRVNIRVNHGAALSLNGGYSANEIEQSIEIILGYTALDCVPSIWAKSVANRVSDAGLDPPQKLSVCHVSHPFVAWYARIAASRVPFQHMPSIGPV